ncbi:MAG: AI-2E family transporter [Gammaproteobacteria bacterium]
MTDSQKWLVLTGVILSGWLVYLLAPVLTPFLVAALLAYLCDPLVDRLQVRVSRTLAVILVFASLLAVFFISLLILIPLLHEQTLAMVRRLPEFLAWIEERLLPLLTSLGIDAASINLDSVRNTLQENWRDIGNIAGSVFMQISDSGQAIIAWFAYLVLVPVVTFYLLRDWDRLIDKLGLMIPRRYENTVVTLIRDCDSILSEFLRGQLLVMLVLALIYSIGLWLAGIEFALLIGMVAGLISFVPYLGSIVGIGLAGIAAFMQYQDILHLVYVALVFGGGQLIEGMFLSPLLVGDRIGLHPVAVIFAVMAGGQLFGFIGVLLALPVAAVCVVLLRFAYEQYKASGLYS